MAAWDSLDASDPLKAKLADQIGALRAWDHRWAVSSVPTSLAVFWGEELGKRLDSATAAERLRALAAASDRLTADFGSWRTPWGEINRFQRLANDPWRPPVYDDAKPSLPVPFTSANWGSLASIAQRGPRTTRRIYGDYGNSFVAAVEFGPKLRAKSILAGGQSGNPASKHFADQAEMYSRGEFKDVLFYKEDIEKALERKYHPGQ